MSYLKIANKGEMEVEALTLLGGTSKRGDESKIGMFGSGNKYALAYFLRNGHTIRIFSGTKEITVGVVKKMFRNQTVEVIAIDGKETSITTDSGPKWKFWYAMREIYSNALDEGLIEMNEASDVMPFENETHFYIKWDSEVQDFYQNIDLYFSKKRKVFNNEPNGYLFLNNDPTELIVYRKGIRCYYEKQNCLFNYDFDNIEINESRVVINRAELILRIHSVVLQSYNSEVVKSFYESSENASFIEQESPNWAYEMDYRLISELYLRNMPNKYIAVGIHSILLDEHEIKECHFVQPWFYDMMIKRFGSSVEHPSLRNESKKGGKRYKVLEKPPKVEAYLKVAEEFFKQVNYNFDNEVLYVRFANTTTSKLIEGKICLSEECFSKGRAYLIQTLLMHDLNLKSKKSDLYSEDFVIEQFVNYMAEQNAYLF